MRNVQQRQFLAAQAVAIACLAAVLDKVLWVGADGVEGLRRKYDAGAMLLAEVAQRKHAIHAGVWCVLACTTTTRYAQHTNAQAAYWRNNSIAADQEFNSGADMQESVCGNSPTGVPSFPGPPWYNYGRGTLIIARSRCDRRCRGLLAALSPQYSA